MKLSDVGQTRQNNFNLLRVLAALGVIFSHSFALVTGSGSYEPYAERLGVSFGSLAVDLFFVSSGFLITGSLLSGKSIARFCWARVLRIYPALWVVTLLMAFVLGPIFTTLPIRLYLTDSETALFLAKNTTLLTGVSVTLPGVFSDAPFGRFVNGSLWTLPHEVRMYGVLALIWVGVRLFKRSPAVGFKRVTLAAFAIVVVGYFVNGFFIHSGRPTLRLAYLFLTGTAYYLLRHHIILSSNLALALLAAIVAAASFNSALFFVTFAIAFPYLVFWMAFVPKGVLLSFNRFGDYSYGIYIYGFPLQQILVVLIGWISVPQMIASSALLALACAAISWHVIEKRALRLKAWTPAFLGGVGTRAAALSTERT